MKVTKDQLRRIVKSAVQAKLREATEMIVTKGQLQQLINEEFTQAMSRRGRLVETMQGDAQVELLIRQLAEAIVDMAVESAENDGPEITNHQFLAQLIEDCRDRLVNVVDDVAEFATAAAHELADMDDDDEMFRQSRLPDEAWADDPSNPHR